MNNIKKLLKSKNLELLQDWQLVVLSNRTALIALGSICPKCKKQSNYTTEVFGVFMCGECKHRYTLSEAIDNLSVGQLEAIADHLEISPCLDCKPNIRTQKE